MPFKVLCLVFVSKWLLELQSIIYGKALPLWKTLIIPNWACAKSFLSSLPLWELAVFAYQLQMCEQIYHYVVMSLFAPQKLVRATSSDWISMFYSVLTTVNIRTLAR